MSWLAHTSKIATRARNCGIPSNASSTPKCARAPVCQWCPASRHVSLPGKHVTQTGATRRFGLTAEASVPLRAPSVLAGHLLAGIVHRVPIRCQEALLFLNASATQDFMAGTVLAPSVQSIATRVAGAQNLQIVYAYQVTGQHELFLSRAN